MNFVTYVSIVVTLCLTRAVGAADDASTRPRNTPLTRPEMKQYLEDMKQRKPRIPLPELTEEEKEKLGERGGGYESRLRAVYMPAGEGRGDFGFGGTSGRGSAGSPGGAAGRSTSGASGGGFSRDADPNMTLDYKFKTQLFWIVSRTNNCQY